MKLVKFEAVKHYAILESWWAQHKWTAPALDHLPINSGWIVESQGRPVCAGFVYYTGTAFCLFEWIVARPDCGLKERAQALDVLISSVKLLTAQVGVKSIFMSMKHDGLIAKLIDDHGFIQTDVSMVNLVGRT